MNNSYLENSSMMTKRGGAGRHDANPTALKNLQYM
jgi:hypothetical protein